MEILAIALIFVTLLLASTFIGTLWLMYLLVIAGLVMIWAVGVVVGVLFVLVAFVGSLLWEINKHYREKQHLRI